LVALVVSRRVYEAIAAVDDEAAESLPVVVKHKGRKTGLEYGVLTERVAGIAG
jgi:hypothetical protein